MRTRLERIADEASGGVFDGLGRAVESRQGQAGEGVEVVRKIPLELIDEDPDNARKHFDAEALAALAEGLSHMGQIQNATVWKDYTTGRYQLVQGHRRFRACRIAKIPTLLCQVLPRDTAEELKAEIAFAENMSRENLKPMEEARHWQRLMDRWQISGAELARRLGVAQSTVAKRLALLKTSGETQKAIEEGRIGATSAYTSKAKKREPKTGEDGTKAKRTITFQTFDTRNGKGRLKRSGTLRGLIADLERIAQEEERRAA